MNLKSRLKKLSSLPPQPKRVIIVKYPAKLVELSCGSQKFYRQQGETVDEFIFKAKEIVLKGQTNLNQIILVGNF